jgi:hypothetical protein
MPYHHELTMSQETATPPRIKITWLIGTLAAFAIFAIIGGYSSRMTWNYSDYDQQRADQRYQTLAKVRHDEQAQITATEWVDQDKGVVRIPVDQAMARSCARTRDHQRRASARSRPGHQFDRGHTTGG